MPGARTSTRSRRWARSRWAGILLFAPGFAGCAAMTQDVDAYYRQMAINYHEAAEKAKVDETSIQNQLRVLGTTGDQSKYIKTQRRLERIQAWEEKCAREEKRFQKAAEWMESHFDIKKPKLAGESNVNDAALDQDAKPADTGSKDPNDTRGRNIPETLTE